MGRDGPDRQSGGGVAGLDVAALARNSGLSAEAGRDLPGFEDLDTTIPRDRTPKNLHYVCMTQYDKKFTLPVVIPPESMDNILANVMGQTNLRNLRVAETEKYAHVTYFFNGGVEQPFPGEDRIMVPSPKVATYDLQPEMSAPELTAKAVEAIGSGKYDMIILNFANPDMIGHAGNLEATEKAITITDDCLKQMVDQLKDNEETAIIITADHGNAEELIDPLTKGEDTQHSTRNVPAIIITPALKGKGNAEASLESLAMESPVGSLVDIAPTVLYMLGIEKPAEMTGSRLISI